MTAEVLKQTLPRWPFDINQAHLCEACGFICDPGVPICPKCQTKLGEFSRPVAPSPKPVMAREDPASAVIGTEVIARCPHCRQTLSIQIRA